MIKPEASADIKNAMSNMAAQHQTTAKVIEILTHS